MAGSTQEKTEQATPKRLQEARRKGQVSKSIDLTGALCLMSMVVFLYAIKDYFFLELQRYLTGYFSDVGHHYGSDTYPLLFLNSALMFSMKVIAPFLGMTLLVVVASNLVQVGFLFSGEALRPNLERLNPLSGLQRIFSRRSLVELFKSILKFTIIGGVTSHLIRKNLSNF
jgi:flagellar biosynthetic protein FlhB